MFLDHLKALENSLIKCVLQAEFVGNRMRNSLESRRYSNLMDLQGAKITNSWLDSQRASQDFNLQERRFFKDFRFCF